MINKQLLDYISYQLKHGLSADVIERKLIAEGEWTHQDVKEAFTALNPVPPSPTSTPVAPAPSPVTPPRAPVTPTPVPPPIAPTPSPVIPVTVAQATRPQVGFVTPKTFTPRPPTPPPVFTQTPISIPQPPKQQFTPPPSFSSMPQAFASRTYTPPVTVGSAPRHSVLRIIIVIFIVSVVVGAGGYMYFYQPDMVQSVIGKFTKKTPVAQTPTQTSVPARKTVSTKPNYVSNDIYSFNLPTGWKPSYIANGGKGIQATNATAGYVVSVAVTPLPKDATDIDSVDKIINTNTVESFIKSEFASATLGKVSSGTLGGEKAAVIAFTIAATSTVDDVQQPSKDAVLQYSAVHDRVLYSVVFKSGLDKGLALLKDAESIVSSFIFK